MSFDQKASKLDTLRKMIAEAEIQFDDDTRELVLKIDTNVIRQKGLEYTGQSEDGSFKTFCFRVEEWDK